MLPDNVGKARKAFYLIRTVLQTWFSPFVTIQQVANYAHCSISAVKRDLATFAG